MVKLDMIDPQFNYGNLEHEHYEREGYCFFRHFLTNESLNECRRGIDRVMTHLQPGRSPEEVISAHQTGAAWIFALATQPRLLDMIERQIGPNIVLWSTHLLCKPPHTGIMVPWHQDSPYWNVGGPLAAGVWLPFDDVEEENGTMEIVPRWHTRGTLPRQQTGEKIFAQAIDPTALPSNLDEIKVRYVLKAGQCAIHHTMIPHNSPPNKSSRWRRVLVLRYMSAAGSMGTKSYEDYRTGAKFDREYYLVRGKDVANRRLKRQPD